MSVRKALRSRWIGIAVALASSLLFPACGDEPGRPAPAPVGAGGDGKAPLGSPMRTPRFDVKGQPFDDQGVQFRIEELIKQECPDHDVCLEVVAEVNPGTNAGTDSECRIVEVPPAGRPVKPGDTLTFLVNQPCEGGETSEPTESPTETTG